MLAKLVEDNYKQLLINAEYITRKRNRLQAKALINETYLKLIEKDLTDKEGYFVKYFTQTMYNMYRGERSTYSKAERINTIHLEYDPGNDDWKDIEIFIDDANNETIDTIVNLSHLGKEKAIKYVELMQFKDRLPPHEKEIFTLHFEQGLSSRSIAKMMQDETGFDMSYIRYNELINKVKKKIHG